MHRYTMNRLWILLLMSCLLVGTGVSIATVTWANGATQNDDLGSGDRSPDFLPPSATGDPDIPINSGLTAPRPKPGIRGETVGRLGSQVAAKPPLTARDLWSLRFQVMIRAWLAMYVR